MSEEAFMRRWGRGLGSLLCAGVLLGCPNPNQTGTDEPGGPSEDNEIPMGDVPPPAPDPMAGTDADAEQAAKVAAAQKVLQKVNDRDPEEEKKKMASSRVVSAKARAALNRRAHGEAVKAARDALKIHEQNVDAMLVIAEVYYREGKYELTRAVTSSALQVDIKTRTPEDSSRAYNLQGFAMLAMNEENAATQSFKKAAEADEKNAAAWNNLGTRYLDVGDVSTATACFKYALELDPRFFKAHLNYGASLRAERKWEEAEAALRKALELRPGYAEAYFNLGVLYLDADPFPGLDTTQRLNKAIQNLAKYREMAKGTGSESASRPKGIGVEGSAKAPPPRVSKERADDYIRVANKGIDRENRRLEREKERQTTATSGDPAGDPTTADPAVAGEGGGDPAGGGEEPPTPQGPGDEPPTPQGPGAESPTPQGPGTNPTPAKPTPQGPGTTPTPAKPTPQGPGTTPAPAKPAPQGPTTQEPPPAKPAPAKPAPAKPAPAKPAPAKPAPQEPPPAKPAPQGPTTQKPPPAKPAPQGPTTQKPPPAKPSGPAPTPVKPSVQKPQSASWSGAAPVFKKVLRNPVSRGTRSAPPTLNSMEAGAPSSACVDLVLSSLDASCIDRVHGHRTHDPRLCGDTSSLRSFARIG